MKNNEFPPIITMSHYWVVLQTRQIKNTSFDPQICNKQNPTEKKSPLQKLNCHFPLSISISLSVSVSVSVSLSLSLSLSSTAFARPPATPPPLHPLPPRRVPP